LKIHGWRINSCNTCQVFQKRELCFFNYFVQYLSYFCLFDFFFVIVESSTSTHTLLCLSRNVFQCGNSKTNHHEQFSFFTKHWTIETLNKFKVLWEKQNIFRDFSFFRSLELDYCETCHSAEPYRVRIEFSRKIGNEPWSS
jgi:hypothetical protein